LIFPRPPEASAPKNFGSVNGNGVTAKPVILLDELELLDLELLLLIELKLEALLKLEGELIDEKELMLEGELLLLIELKLDILLLELKDEPLDGIEGAKELILLLDVEVLVGINAFMFADVELAPSGINTATAVEVTEELEPPTEAKPAG